MNSELHVQAGLWHGNAVLFLEGEAPDRRTGGGMAEDALYQVALRGGLRLTTDLALLDPRPVRAWRVVIDDDHQVTLEWPHHRPLFDHIPLDLPEGWLPTATETGVVLLFAGYGLSMREHATDGESHPLRHMEHVAYTGALAAGAVRVSLPVEPRYPVDVAIPASRSPMDEPAQEPLPRGQRVMTG
ncbi:MAG: hypothetical protein WBA97_27385 [Actinophytocola sp.]|uniref:hypothetical protein n=1 Tax=Actinophytocola sp. TaxID=1872138 RepID=UPI003C72A5D5